MKKITFLLLMSAGFFAVSNAQIAGNECEKTCEIEKVVQEGALLGVRIQGVQCGSAGVFVKEVLKNTAAERYGFQINDVIYYVDGNEIMNTKQLVDLIASHQPSDLVTVTYTRNGKEITEDVVLGAKTSKIVKETICCDDKDPFFNSLNLNLFPIKLRSSLNLHPTNIKENESEISTFFVENSFPIPQLSMTLNIFLTILCKNPRAFISRQYKSSSIYRDSLLYLLYSILRFFVLSFCQQF